MLALQTVHSAYGNIRALRGISLTVERGEVVTLIGSNGAGKTTTLRTIMGLLVPQAGQITLEGQRIEGLATDRIVRLGIAQSPEGRHIFPRMSVLGQRAGTLSGGEQQMLAMGRALMARPKVLLLDEPSMGLAPLLVETIFSIIRTINAEGTTILLVEQNARMALQVAHRGYVLQSGEIVLHDTASALLRSDVVRKSYLGEK